MIFILPRVFRRHIQGQTRKLHHLVHATWRPYCVRFDLKIYKMRTESEKHENGREALTSHVEAINLKQVVRQDGWNLRSPHVISRYHIWRSQGFNHVVPQLAPNIPKFFSETLRILSRPPVYFHDFMTPFAFYIILNQILHNLVAMSRARDGQVSAFVPGYGVEIPSEAWISFFESLRFIISCTCSSNVCLAEK
jgi:hypothetical protein